jgi:hypothetical protein
MLNVRTIFVIVEENHDWSQIKGSSSAPYINNTLLAMGGYATNDFNTVGGTVIHPSLPNYLTLEAGSNFGITDDNGPSSHVLTTTQHLVTLLKNAGRTWNGYFENVNGTDCPQGGESAPDSWNGLIINGTFAIRHDPFPYFVDTGNGDSTNAYCIAHTHQMQQLQIDLAANTVAQYNFIVPNTCDDGHDTCAGANPVQYTDKWLSTHVPVILNSAAYRNNGLVIITWDEGTSGPIGLIVLSPLAKKNYVSTVAYTHSSIVRSVEEILSVSPLLNEAANKKDLADFF